MAITEQIQKPWQWRKASGGCRPTSDHRLGRWRFHAYDVNDNSACEPMLGLAASCEEPNEGSELCDDCIEFVKANPAGRNKRTYPSE